VSCQAWPIPWSSWVHLFLLKVNKKWRGKKLI
jgi:hypothetical protein